MEILVVMGLVAGGMALFYYFSEEQSLKRHLRKTKLSKIGELKESEMGRIVGKARRCDKLLEAPLSLRPCIAYRAVVEEKRSGKNATWRTIIKESDGVRFFLEDGSGRALVDPKDAKIALEVDARSSSGTFDDPTDAERRFLARHSKNPEGFFGFNRSLRYYEYLIEEGELVAVLGAGVREPDPEAAPTEAYRGEQPTRLLLTSSAKYPLLISDAPETTKES